jgi:site-specific recombinase XerD
MLLGILGLRTSTLIAINIEDIDLTCGLIWIREKGRRQRNLILPHSLCKIIHKYLQLRRRKKGPFLISKRKKRISQRTLQDIFRTAADQIGIDKKQRALFVVDRLFDELLRYLAHPKSPREKLSPLFPADNKITAISNNRVQRIVKDQARKAGIAAKVTPRVLRHSFATEMYHNNVPLSAIQNMMGHDSIADTSIYIHVSDKFS